jgi:hypothetical protein
MMITSITAMIEHPDAFTKHYVDVIVPNIALLCSLSIGLTVSSIKTIMSAHLHHQRRC